MESAEERSAARVVIVQCPETHPGSASDNAHSVGTARCCAAEWIDPEIVHVAMSVRAKIGRVKVLVAHKEITRARPRIGYYLEQSRRAEAAGRQVGRAEISEALAVCR